MEEIKNWPKLILDELPSVVKPLFFVSIYIIAFLLLAQSLNLSSSFYFISGDKLFNLAFYLGLFSLTFRALDNAPLAIKRYQLKHSYPINLLNKDYFLVQYEGHDAIYVFEKKDAKRKLWIANLKTKRYLWGDVSPKRPQDISVINFNDYPLGDNKDGIIDITNSTWVDNIYVAFFSALSILFVVLVLNLKTS